MNAVVDAAVRFLDAVHVAYLGTTQTEPTAAEVEGAVEAELGTKVTEALS